MALSQRTKIVTKDLGDPSIIKTLPDDVKRHMLGTIVGIVTGFVERGNPKDPTEKFEGLSGQFRSIPADDKRDELESGVCFLPDAFHNMVAGPFRKMQDTDKNAQLRFAFEIYSIRAQNPAGYSWEFKPKIEAAGGNPLDELIADLGEVKVVQGRKTLALAPPAKK
ncbi:MAG: hypothetical protein KGJ13_07210 [Patescibacteria group bacterium]|nr:hypothetical protein [Patescibacteria group bacterium]